MLRVIVGLSTVEEVNLRNAPVEDVSKEQRISREMRFPIYHHQWAQTA